MEVKLNNKGFGMREMIIWLAVFLVFFLISLYNLNSYYRALEKRQNEDTKVQETIKKDDTDEEETEPVVQVDYDYYSSLENRVYTATLNYMNENPFDLTSSIEKVMTDTLVNLNYLVAFKDQFGNDTCSGYSNVYQDENGEYVIKSYITCINYSTEGY